jgi:hypothetical protein
MAHKTGMLYCMRLWACWLTGLPEKSRSSVK